MSGPELGGSTDLDGSRVGRLCTWGRLFGHYSSRKLTTTVHHSKAENEVYGFLKSKKSGLLGLTRTLAAFAPSERSADMTVPR